MSIENDRILITYRTDSIGRVLILPSRNAPTDLLRGPARLSPPDAEIEVDEAV
jgi:hypothetical protein